MFHWLMCIRIVRLYSSDLSKPTTKLATIFFMYDLRAVRYTGLYVTAKTLTKVSPSTTGRHTEGNKSMDLFILGFGAG